MEVDTNELLHRIGMVLRVISDKMDRLIEIGERVEGQVRLPSEEEAKTVADVLRNNACIPSDAVAGEPPKKWRILHPGETVRSSDWENADSNSESDPPNGLGWRRADWRRIGRSVRKDDNVIFARLVADEPAKEPEHQAGPQPDPGEGYRILAKNPPEDLQPGDEYMLASMSWDISESARTNGQQNESLWYRRKIETPKPPEPEYRKPVLPADCGKWCEFSDDSISWEEGDLIGWRANPNTFNWESGHDFYRYARIKKDA
jgi:hypothetical protein